MSMKGTPATYSTSCLCLPADFCVVRRIYQQPRPLAFQPLRFPPRLLLSLSRQGIKDTSTITTTISNGFFSGDITLSASGLPSGTTVSFSLDPIPPSGSGNSAMTITVGNSTPTGTYPITVTGTGGKLQQTTTVTANGVKPREAISRFW